MLELAHKLADSDAKFFGGWVLAGAEAHIHQPAEAMDNQVLLAKERKSIIRVAGIAADGSLAKELRVFLVLPKHKLGTKPLEPEAIKGDLLTKHSFTTQEIADYVAYTGDENVIHKGEHPIVPGLCMAAWLQRELALTELDWRITFVAPVYAGDELCIYRTEGQLAAYVGAINVFVIKEL